MNTEIYYFSGTGNSLIVILLAPLSKPIKRNFLKEFNELINTSDLSYPELIPLLDRIFSSNEKCDGCGICARICPVNNIEIIDNKPSWQHHCEDCFACLQWCPQEAIMDAEPGGRFVRFSWVSATVGPQEPSPWFSVQ